MSSAARSCSDQEAALRLAVDGLAAEREVVLVTVLSTYGSAPRRPGAIWVIVDPASGRPEMQGSISGGCVEDDLLDWLARRPARDGPVIRSYDGREYPGLPCGGWASGRDSPPASHPPSRPFRAAGRSGGKSS